MHRLAESRSAQATARYLEGIGLLERFRTTRDWGELESAEHQFSEASRIDPHYDAARFYLGVSQEMRGKHEEAANQFEKLRAKVQGDKEPDLELLYNLGLSYFHQYRRPAYERAAQYLKQLVEFTGRSTLQKELQGHRRRRETTRLLGKAVLAQVYSHLSILPVGVSEEEFRAEATKNYRRALETATEALNEFNTAHDELDPDLVRDIGWGLHNAIGHASLYAFRREGDPELAERSITEFTRALEFDPENYRVLGNLGSTHLFLAEWASKKGNSRAGRHFDMEEHLTAAEQLFQRILQIKPNYDFAYFRLARIAMMRAKFESAKSFIDRAREHPSEMTPEYLDNMLAEIKRAQEHLGGRLS